MIQKKEKRKYGWFLEPPKNGVAGNCKTKWIPIYLSSYEKLISSHQTIDKMRSDNNDLLNE